MRGGRHRWLRMRGGLTEKGAQVVENEGSTERQAQVVKNEGWVDGKHHHDWISLK